jgi:hypothetical protein
LKKEERNWSEREKSGRKIINHALKNVLFEKKKPTRKKGLEVSVR